MALRTSGAESSRHGENDGNRINLRDQNDAVRVLCRYIASRVDLPQPDATGDRRNDMRVGQVQLLIVDLRLVAFNAAFILLDDPDLIFRLLTRDQVLLPQCLIAAQVVARLIKKSLIVQQLPFELGLLQPHRGADQSERGNRLY